MKELKTLSEKIYNVTTNHRTWITLGYWLKGEDVKEFIKLLKASINLLSTKHVDNQMYVATEHISKELDKLAGDKLK